MQPLIQMVVIFEKHGNTFEVKYEMIEKPCRMRASNFVRRWELLQLEENTEHLFSDWVDELEQVLKLDLSPNGVAKMAAEYYSEPHGSQVALGLHHTGDKLKYLDISKHLRLQTKMKAHTVLLELDILNKNAIKLTVTIYVTNEL